MRKLTNIGCGVVLALMVCTIVIVTVLSWADASTATPKVVAPTSRNNVILRAATGNDYVQMFDELSGNPNATRLPDGWGCKKLSERITYDDGYGPMYFYKLNCNGRIGYVNDQWVDD